MNKFQLLSYLAVLSQTTNQDIFYLKELEKEIKTKINFRKNPKCIICGKELKITQKRCCSKECKQKFRKLIKG